MSYASFVARRAAFAVLAAFLVVSMTFLVSVAVPNAQLGAKIASAQRGDATPAEIEQIKENFWEKRGGKKTSDRYTKFMIGFLTMDWGESYELNEPVTDILTNRVPYTLMYVVPGVLGAFLVGALLGVVSAFSRRSVVDNASRLSAYFLMGVPAFWLVHYLSAAHPWTMPWLQPSRAVISATHRINEVWAISHPFRYVWPALVLSLGLVAGLLQHSRAESLEYEGADFVKLLEAKGASRVRVARHVLRNAAIPILTLSFVEVLGVLMLNIYVIEAVFNIPGLGTISLFAIENQDTPLILGTTMLLVFFGIGGNFLQDVLYGYLDPAINED